MSKISTFKRKKDKQLEYQQNLREEKMDSYSNCDACFVFSGFALFFKIFQYPGHVLGGVSNIALFP